MRVVGIDGCRGGWAVVTATHTGSRLDDVAIERRDTLSALFDDGRTGAIAAVAIDMPIGLLDTHPRPADVAARRLLGPRRSSIFPTPVRSVLGASDYDEANRRSRAVCGKGISKQAFHLLPKIEEIDAIIDAGDQDRVVEAHPECAFARLHDGPLLEPKRTAAGRRLRRSLLRSWFDERDLTRVLDDSRPSAVPIGDAIDACVLVITAARLCEGTARRFGGEVDARGLRAEIVY